MTDIFASVWTPDLATELAPIPARKQVQWQHPLNGPGMGQLSVAYDDPAAQYLTARNIVRFWYQGAYRYAFRIQKPKRTVVATNGEEDRRLFVAGPGVFQVLSDAALFPEYGLTRQSADQRAFSFASAQSDWYIPGEWTAPQGVLWTAETTSRKGNPPDWPDRGAYWIWTSNPETGLSGGETSYFRSSFTLSAATQVTIYATADNILELYLDGQEILTSDITDPFAWQRTFTYPTTLAAGPHLLAARVTNTPNWPTANPAGFLCTVATVNAQGQPQTIIRRTDTANWVSRAEGSGPPGWHAAAILRTFVQEAQARRSNWTSFGHLTMDFTATADSTGAAWTDLVDRSFDVGVKGADLAEQLCEQGIDVDVTADLVLRAWKQRGVDRSTGTNPLVLRPALNLSGYEVETDLSLVTDLLVRTPNGWVEVSSANIGADGPFEDFLSLGSAASDGQAQRQAQSTFTEVAQPVSTVTAACLPVPGATPYADFGLGDTVLAPDGAGGTKAVRVMGITVDESDSGVVTFTPELYA